MYAADKPSENTVAWIAAEVDQVIAVCGGDARDAVRALMIANTHLELEIERLVHAVSTGFARGRIRRRKDLDAAKDNDEDKKAG